MAAYHEHDNQCNKIFCPWKFSQAIMASFEPLVIGFYNYWRCLYYTFEHIFCLFVCLFVCLFCGGTVNDLYGRRTSLLGKLSLSVVFNEIRVVMRLDWFVFQEPILARD